MDYSAVGGQRLIPHSSDTVVTSLRFEKKGIDIFSDQEINASSASNLSGNLKTCSYNLVTISGEHGKPIFVLGQTSDLAFIC